MSLNFKKKGAQTALIAALGLVVLSGCGGSGSGTTGIGNIPGGTTGGIGSGGCIPIQSPVGFVGQNIHFDTYNLVGGQLPPIDTWPTKLVGQVGIGSGGIGNGGAMGSTALQAQSFDGTIQMTAFRLNQQTQPYGQPYNQPYNPYQPNPYSYSTVGSVQGSLTLSPTTQQEIMQSLGYNQYSQPYGQPYNPYNPYPTVPQPQIQQQACVSNVAFNLGYAGNRPYGKVYIYLNRTQHGFVLMY
ncbi:MAG: hypothetical protein IT285_03810 [Bdellovibrionales bacterium]|nr:hypothetical protein [Bdellovibrionales bacterium]